LITPSIMNGISPIFMVFLSDEDSRYIIYFFDLINFSVL
jgi:hypothetical protein